jgi:hypothetical protein
MATWYIDSNVNEGFPTWTNFISAPSGWTDTGNVPLNKLVWRIRNGVNDNYPFLGFWFDSSSGQSTGEMEIGGSQTNYPNGFSNGNYENVRNNLDNTAMTPYTNYITDVNNQIALALSDKAYVVNDTVLQTIINKLNDSSIYDNTKKEIMQSVFGSNVYDGIVMCRAFPFSLTYSATTSTPTLFGLFPLGVTGIPSCTQFVKHCYMGAQNIEANQAWELESIEWSIYLPYAGTFPIDIRSNEPLQLYLDIDLINNVGEYTLLQNGQVVNCWKCVIGYDMPISLTRGATMSNAFGMVTNTISKGLGLLTTAVAGPVAGAVVGSGIHGTEHYNVSAPKVGSLSGCASYPKPRLIAKIPKVHKDAFGYPEILGLNRSSCYIQLNSCSGFTQCENYKCDVILATTEEKTEIERLMNNGVIL